MMKLAEMQSDSGKRNLKHQKEGHPGCFPVKLASEAQVQSFGVEDPDSG